MDGTLMGITAASLVAALEEPATVAERCFAAFLLGRHGFVALKTALMLPYKGLGRGTLSRYTHRAGKTEKIKNPPLKSSEIQGHASGFLSFFTAKTEGPSLGLFGTLDRECVELSS